MTPDARNFVPSGPLTFDPVTTLPGTVRLFARLIGLSMVKPAWLPDDTVLDNKGLVFRNFRMDAEKLDRFKQVCGYESNGPEVPAPFVQTLFIRVISKFIGSGRFPITPMGLIQVGQSFTLKQPLGVDTPLDLFCRILDMARTDRGIYTRFLMEARHADALVWEGTATYFTRAKNPPPKTKKPVPEDTPLPVRETIRVPENTGRQYAGVSGDYNPHHLYAWTARFIGFKQAIAHGMWSLARTCASLEQEWGYPEHVHMEGALKLPIFLPGTVTLGYEARDNAIDFELRGSETGLPHLKGSFRSRPE